MLPAVLAVLLLLSPTAARKIAMLVAVEGTVTVQATDGTKRPAEVMDLLTAGEQVTVGADGEAELVVLKDNHRERLPRGTRATLAADGCTPAEAVERQAAVSTHVPYERVRRFTGAGRAGGVSLRDPTLPDVLPTVTPLFGSTLLTDRPTLTWRPIEGATEYLIRLRRGRLDTGGIGGRVVWTARTREPRLAYPEKEKPLQPGGVYNWSVAVRPGEKEERIVWESQFAVATRAETAELDIRRQGEDNLRKIVALMERRSPRYAALRYPRPCSVEQARACLGKNEVALLYVLGAETSCVVLLHGEPGRDEPASGLAIFPLPPAEDIANLVDALTEWQALDRPARARSLGAEGYDLLLAPVADRIRGKDLVIVPSGALCYLPFELLVEGAGPKEQGPYLVEKHRLRYAPSLTALHLTRQWEESRPRPARSLWAMGDPVYELSDERLRGPKELPPPAADTLREYASRLRSGSALRFTRLPFSGEEVYSVAGVLHAPKEGVRTGLRATEGAVKEASQKGELSQARYVHFAVHGILGLDVGRQPSLVLSLVGEGDEDGFLQLDEVTGLSLNADLVALSACRSGQGRLCDGEGVRGLARAFLHAGSRGVLCSLWPVADRDTADLMASIYRQLQAGKPAVDALRATQQALIAEGKPPRCWAAFVLVGE